MRSLNAHGLQVFQAIASGRSDVSTGVLVEQDVLHVLGRHLPFQVNELQRGGPVGYHYQLLHLVALAADVELGGRHRALLLHQQLVARGLHQFADVFQQIRFDHFVHRRDNLHRVQLRSRLADVDVFREQAGVHLQHGFGDIDGRHVLPVTVFLEQLLLGLAQQR